MLIEVVKGLKGNKVVVQHPEHKMITLLGVTTIEETRGLTINCAEGQFGYYAYIVLASEEVADCKWAFEK